jgi:hypothetical protein
VDSVPKVESVLWSQAGWHCEHWVTANPVKTEVVLCEGNRSRARRFCSGKEDALRVARRWKHYHDSGRRDFSDLWLSYPLLALRTATSSSARLFGTNRSSPLTSP